MFWQKKCYKCTWCTIGVNLVLGFDFDGMNKTMWLEGAKREKLITLLKGWVRTGTRGTAGIPFKEFESTVEKIRHAFTCIPAGVGLLSLCNRVLQACPQYVFLNCNQWLLTALEGCRTLLRESTQEPTKCRELTCGWPDFVGIVDASGQDIGEVIFGELTACTPTVFQWQWSENLTAKIKTFCNPGGTISNSDLEMAGLLLLWLVMEGMCGTLKEKHVTLLSNNSPMVGWVERLALKRSKVATHLIQALAMYLKTNRTCPLTPMHIPGHQHTIAAIPSCSFGSHPAWHCATDSNVLTLFNSMFPLPNQQSWTVFCPNYKVAMHVISALRMQPLKLDGWRRLPKVGRHVGKIGAPTFSLWEWIHTCNTPLSKSASDVLLEQVSLAGDKRCKVAWFLAQSQPLARRLPWPATIIQQR